MSHFSSIQVKFLNRDALIKTLHAEFPQSEGYSVTVDVAGKNTLELKNHFHQPSKQVAIRVTKDTPQREIHVMGFQSDAEGCLHGIVDEWIASRHVFNDARREVLPYINSRYARQVQIDVIEEKGWNWEEVVLTEEQKLENGLTLPVGTVQIRVTAAASTPAYL